MKKKKAIIGAFTPEAILKRKIRVHLRKLGFHKSPDGALLPPSSSKESIRALHFEQRKVGLKAHREFVQRALPTLQHHFAEGGEIDPEKVEPNLELIEAGSLAIAISFDWRVCLGQCRCPWGSAGACAISYGTRATRS